MIVHRHLLPLTSIACFLFLSACQQPQGIQEPEDILFLGNSITYGGRYVDYIETAFILQEQRHAIRMVDLGLSSETISGLSEEDHPFPRPHVLNRLEACLDSIQPDKVVACYGINCGIYHPWDESRFAAYQAGINTLINTCKGRNIDLTLLTPPPFAARLRDTFPEPEESGYSYRFPYDNYDAVMLQYTEWLLSFEDPEVEVIDIRTPLEQHMAKAYTAKDIIHPLPLGHALIAESILEAWNRPVFPQVLDTGHDLTADDRDWQALEALVRAQREGYDRSLLNHIGHDHPGISQKGFPELPKAQSTFETLEGEIERLLRKLFASDSIPIQS